jgi:hypothetical protein
MTKIPPDTTTDTPIIEQARQRLRQILGREGLLQERVTVMARPLTPEEAIGTPGRRDFPIITGKERMVEATVRGSRGHAFTDSAREFMGSVGEVLDLELDCNQRRAIFTATLNAALSHLDLVSATVHCKDEDPEKCALEIAGELGKRLTSGTVGLVGLNPAIAERLVDTFGVQRVLITDLCQDNVGARRFGVMVMDGAHQTRELVEASDLLLVTGTTLVNGTFDAINRLAQELGTELILYGVTAAGVCQLMEIPRLCPRGQDG